MCGITGFFLNSKSLDRNFLIKNLENMKSKLNHRGPDASGIWLSEDSCLGLGHTRLSIRDLSIKGNQPMISQNKKYILAYNGELYFTKTLEEEIKKNKITLKSNSDTEILLEYFSLFGLEKTLNNINGIFSFAIYDINKKKLFLARDRFGVKPLYWCKLNDSLCFGSELKSLKVFYKFDNTLNVKSINYFITYGNIPAPLSIYKHVQKLEPGYFLEIDQNLSVKKKQYYNIQNLCLTKKNNFSFNENINILDNKINTIIKEQMVSDVSIGSYLSSGVDSSLITAMMCLNSKKKIDTYSIGFENKKFDETDDSKKIANFLGTNHTTVKLNDNDIKNYFDNISNFYDEPFSDSSQLPTLLISELSKKKTKVILSGDGGDELFGGYTRYNDCIKKLEPSLKIPPKEIIKKLVAKYSSIIPDKIQDAIGKLFSKNDLSKKIKLYKKYNSELDINKVYYYMMSTIPKDDEVINKEFIIDQVHNYNVPDLCINNFENLMLCDTLNYLPNDILTKVDRASMAFSQEVRVPFLDHNLVEFAWSIPVAFKISKQNNKKILKKILETKIPKDLIQKTKRGFGVPIDDLLRNKVFEFNKFYFEEGMLKKNNFINFEKVKQIYTSHKNGANNFGYKLWNILILQKWLHDNDYIN